MPRVLVCAMIALLTLMAVGCNHRSVHANATIQSDEWDHVKYGSLSIESEPAGALVSIRPIWSGNMRASLRRHNVHQAQDVANQGEWQTIGSTPIKEYKLATEMRGTKKDNGVEFEANLHLSQLSVRLEKAGYQTRIIDNVAPTGLTLHVDLEPVPEDAPQSEPAAEATP